MKLLLAEVAAAMAALESSSSASGAVSYTGDAAPAAPGLPLLPLNPLLHGWHNQSERNKLRGAWLGLNGGADGPLMVFFRVQAPQGVENRQLCVLCPTVASRLPCSGI
jgi:hypothetical protein